MTKLTEILQLLEGRIEECTERCARMAAYGREDLWWFEDTLNLNKKLHKIIEAKIKSSYLQ